MREGTYFKGVLQVRWLPSAVDGDGEPWTGISAEGLNSVGGPLVIWLADEDTDDVGMRDHIVAAHNACLDLGMDPADLEPKVRALVAALEALNDAVEEHRQAYGGERLLNAIGGLSRAQEQARALLQEEGQHDG